VGDSPYDEADNLVELVMKLPNSKEPTFTRTFTAPAGIIPHKHILLQAHFSVLELLLSLTGTAEVLRCVAGKFKGSSHLQRQHKIPQHLNAS